jgi:2-keto-4-pentenoate hydratase/2-oxohepta-3-ene-1,7-dioic acid hydratase in catechol pathway
VKLARRKVQGADGTTIRIVAANRDSPWYDIRAGLRQHLLQNGASQDAAERIAAATLPASMSAALAGGTAFTDAVRKVLGDRPEEAVVEEPVLASALDPAGYRDFMVFEEHFSFGYRWQGKPVPEIMYELPVSYAADPSSFLGPGDVVPWPAYTQRLDYELELGILIGRAGTGLTPENALEHVLGLTILNDISARDIQAREMTGGLGPSKGKHFASVAGPVITTLDEIPAEGLGMRVRVNGETWCETTSAQMVWSVAEIVAWASQGELLRPGVLLGTGTCNGGSTVELGKKPAPGDCIELEADHLGTLANVLGEPGPEPWWPRPRERASDGRAARCGSSPSRGDSLGDERRVDQLRTSRRPSRAGSPPLAIAVMTTAPAGYCPARFTEELAESYLAAAVKAATEIGRLA